MAERVGFSPFFDVFRCLFPAFWKAILYNKDAQCAVDDMFKHTEYKDFEELRYLTPEYGLETPFKRYKLLDIAKELINIAMQSLEMMQTDEAQYLEPLAYYVKNGKTQADIVISKLKELNEITVEDLKKLNLTVK